jgi:N-acetyl-gamma-glutamyl-phosphate reductase
MDGGILTTCYAEPTDEVSDETLLATLQEFYAREPFVRVTKSLPNTKHVADTNFCDVAARTVRGRVIVISAIDNLVKGASGAAVQNFNIMHGFEETTALL